jgi:hypothetical protein
MAHQWERVLINLYSPINHKTGRRIVEIIYAPSICFMLSKANSEGLNSGSKIRFAMDPKKNLRVSNGILLCGLPIAPV